MSISSSYFFGGGGLSRNGRIDVLLGPMFAGKSTELLRMLRREEIAKKKILLIKYAKDTRFTQNDTVQTRDGVKRDGVSTLKLRDVGKQLLQHADVIGIDEGQFFTDIVSFCEHWANEGKHVIVAALDGNFKREPFGAILQLIPLAEHVTKLSAICSQCGNKAAFSQLLLDESVMCSSNNILIGDVETYRAACRTCYHQKKLSMPSITTTTTKATTLPL